MKGIFWQSRIKSTSSFRVGISFVLICFCISLQSKVNAQTILDKSHILEHTEDTLGLEYRYVTVNDIYNSNVAIDTFETPVFLSSVYTSDKGKYINTGNYGSALYPLYHKIQTNSGFNTGYDQYHIYQVRKESFRFYEQNRPISNLFFSQLGNQDNIVVGADFSRNFDNGISISLNYKRISQKGFYNEQDAKSTAFGIGIRYESPSKKYNSILLFTQNANEEKFNGGILHDSLLTERFRKSIPTHLSGAAGRQQEQTLSFIQYYRLNNPLNSKWNLYLQNDLTYQPSYFKFWDKDITDSLSISFYSLHCNDLTPNGIRRYTDIKRYSESFFIHGDNITGLMGKVGLIYDYYDITDTPTSYKRSDLTAVAEGRIPFLKVLNIDVLGKIGLLKNIGTFDLSADMGINIGKIGTLSGGIRLFRYEPSYRDTRLNINALSVIDTSFTNPFGTVIHATFKIPALQLSVSLIQSVINNPVYWDLNGRAAQQNGISTISQLDIQYLLHTKHLGFDNNVYFQLQSNHLLPIPDYFSTHKLYYKGIWFDKALEINIGFEGRLIPAYKGPAFQPLSGGYHLSDTSLPFAPTANLFVNTKISSFRALFTLENFSQYWLKNNVYTVVGYPVFDPAFRIGIQWLLKD